VTVCVGLLTDKQKKSAAMATSAREVIVFSFAMVLPQLRKGVVFLFRKRKGSVASSDECLENHR
jgi:hypothetical protein